ncbi:MAG: transglycosylase SLT domain-containing protein [Candidatus Bipolaricaulota bacterium]
MKWAVLSIALVGVALSLVVALWPGGDAASPSLADYRALRAAQKSLPASIASIEALAAGDGAVAWQACVLAGHAHAAAGRFARGAEFLARALALRATSALQLEHATLLEAAGDRPAAKDAWEELLPRSEAVAAIQRLETDPERLARQLVAAGRPSAALPLVSPPANDAARLTRARALLALSRAAEAAEEYSRVLAATSWSDTTVRIEYGRALERAGQADAALSVYRGAGSSGAFREGSLLETLGRSREAADAYRRSSDPEALWRAARLLEALGEADEALAVYRILASGASRARDDALLRVVQLERNAGRAAAADEAASGLPAAFLWILGKPVPSVVPASSAHPSSPSVLRTAGALLASHGMPWAEVELDFALRTADPAARLAIGTWYAENAAPRQAFLVGAPLLAEAPSRDAARLAYPLAWIEIVERWSSIYGVDKYLVLAVIREESNYLATAVSSSRALGLMQLLPSTGTWIAESKLGLRVESEAFFFDPENNIRLGTWYLSYLLDLFDGDLVRAVSAYNGGNGNVTRWTEAAGAVQRADVPGALVSTETREYLVKVLQSWLAYRELYAA